MSITRRRLLKANKKVDNGRPLSVFGAGDQIFDGTKDMYCKFSLSYMEHTNADNIALCAWSSGESDGRYIVKYYGLGFTFFCTPYTSTDTTVSSREYDRVFSWPYLGSGSSFSGPQVDFAKVHIEITDPNNVVYQKEFSIRNPYFSVILLNNNDYNNYLGIDAGQLTSQINFANRGGFAANTYMLTSQPEHIYIDVSNSNLGTNWAYFSSTYLTGAGSEKYLWSISNMPAGKYTVKLWIHYLMPGANDIQGGAVTNWAQISSTEYASKSYHSGYFLNNGFDEWIESSGIENKFIKVDTSE